MKNQIQEFKDSSEYQDILQEMQVLSIIDKVAIFECFMDSVATFECEHDGFVHQFCVITEDDFMKEMEIIDILNFKYVLFFEHTIFGLDGNEKTAIASKKYWRNSTDL